MIVKRTFEEQNTEKGEMLTVTLEMRHAISECIKLAKKEYKSKHK